MNVLSLFDGVSCGYLALMRAGIPISSYYASEIDKHAIKVSQHNNKQIEHLGNVENVKKRENIDLLLAGSPCQGFSRAGKQLNFSDPRSKLFFEFVRILKESNPKYFILENVLMKQEFQDIITEYLGVEPILIDSRLVSAQSRPRLYWTNIPNVTQPKDKNIKFSELIGGCAAAMRGRRIDLTTMKNSTDKEIPIRQFIECRKDDKANCLTTASKNSLVVPEYKSRRLVKDSEFRYITVKEAELLQTIPLGYTSCISKTQSLKALGNAWTVDVVAHILSFIP